MQQINEIIDNIKAIETFQIIDILIAILIFLIFRILSSVLSYITIRMFKPKIKNKKVIKESAFYAPLRAFYILLGIYLAIIFLKISLGIDENIIIIVNKVFKIVSIVIFAKGLSNSLTVKSSFVNKIKEKISPDIEDAMFKFLLRAIRIVIYIISGFLVVTELGYNLNGLVAGLGLGSVVITLAAQDTAKNLFGGMVIFLDKPFSVGDWIKIKDYEGTVEDITFRSTRVRVPENSIVNIPNSVIANESIINCSKMEKRRYKTNLCLELDTSLEKVEIVQSRLKDFLINHENVISDSIMIRFDDIIDNGMNILVCCYIDFVDFASFIKVKECINFNIIKILNEENVELAYDTKSVVIKK